MMPGPSERSAKTTWRNVQKGNLLLQWGKGNSWEGREKKKKKDLLCKVEEKLFWQTAGFQNPEKSKRGGWPATPPKRKKKK